MNEIIINQGDKTFTDRLEIQRGNTLSSNMQRDNVTGQIALHYSRRNVRTRSINSQLRCNVIKQLKIPPGCQKGKERVPTERAATYHGSNRVGQKERVNHLASWSFLVSDKVVSKTSASLYLYPAFPAFPAFEVVNLDSLFHVQIRSRSKNSR